MPGRLTSLQRELLRALLESGVTIEDILGELELQVQFLPPTIEGGGGGEGTVVSSSSLSSTSNQIQIGNVTSFSITNAAQQPDIKPRLTTSTDGTPHHQTDNGRQFINSTVGADDDVDDEDPSEDNQDIFDEEEEDDDDDENETQFTGSYGLMETGTLRDQLLR